MKVNTITIVGGGTSGWLAAAYLYHNNPNLTVTVIDKEVGNPIGVGEATLLNFKFFMDECGFNIDEWFTELDAGYKSGILFTNWSKPGHDIWHPFYKGRRPVSSTITIHELWTLCQHLDFKKYALGYYDCSITHNTVDSSNLNNYAYHVDCSKLVLYVQAKLKDKIKIIRSDVVNVVNNSTGIDYLELKNGELIKSDLFIDCTGFKNVLRTPTRRIDLQDRLFVNTAIACPVQYQDKPNEFKPYAICEAVDHGWIWKIGVASRIGSGLVFNRNITSIDEAKDYFVEHWNHRIKKENIRVIDWTPFYNEDQWAGNVISIGLSAGFIEPLESSGIALITAGITQLNNAVKEQYYTQDHIDFFNLQMKIFFEDAIDFVNMHYDNTERTSKFWNWVKSVFKPSERMNHFVNLLLDPEIAVPHDGKYNSMFVGSNWFLMLVQLGFAVTPKNINILPELAEEILIKNYTKWEKHHHVIGRLHSAEVDRIRDNSL